MCALVIGLLIQVCVAGTTDTIDEAAPAAHVILIQFDDQPITPVTARFIERAIREAEDSHASVIVIELDTPAGQGCG